MNGIYLRTFKYGHTLHMTRIKEHPKRMLLNAHRSMVFTLDSFWLFYTEC